MSLGKEVQSIIKRNQKVEADKAWETSLTRRLIIALTTYLLIVLFLWIIDMKHPWSNALVPTIAFILSTLSLPFFKKWWLRNIHNK
ncbi:MAG: hypothetical protein KKC75_05980 [Nanoarchaeota archaeon]|nr:hypothetical protein [Nanoarchaeota archaeon]MBU1005446.1 hypothetical protein [Nanoarchaeota archaeon]MBU1946758.1 hypothetical protein [Nanoarchaeota archaeon]